MKNMDVPMFTLLTSACFGFLFYSYWCIRFSPLLP